MTLLNISDLCVQYLGENTDHQAAINVNISLQEGEIFALIGESGSGKSTVAKAIPRLLAPPGVITKGSIHFAGQNLLQMNKEEGQQYRWTDISFVFQSALNALNPTMNLLAHFQDTLSQHTDKTQQQQKKCRNNG